MEVMRAPTHVIFDLDGTLCDSSPGIIAAFQQTLPEFGLVASESALRSLIGPPLWASFRVLGVSDDRYDEAVARYRWWYEREGVARASLYPGVAEVLERLTSSGVRLAVATAKRVDFAQTMLSGLGVAGHFDIIAGSPVDLVLRHKEEIIAEVLDHWGEVTPEDTWMVGDRRYDIAGARHHGLRAVGATWGFGTREELLTAGAHGLVATPSALVDGSMELVG
jgi:phosphoglycolate phosphatase